MESNERLSVLCSQLVRSAAAGAPRKSKGTIADVFVNLGSEASAGHPRIAEVKRRILAKTGEKKLQASWERLVKAISQKMDAIKAARDNPIPIVNMADVARNSGVLPPEAAAAVSRVGVVVLRGVVPQEQARQWKRDLEGYIARNREGIIGFPEDNPVVYELYWSKPQVAARQHPGTVAAINAVNALWHGDDGQIDTQRPRVYVDRCRIRPPQDAGFALAPHVDNGSLERWEDAAYSEVYTAILDGEWEKFNPFNSNRRNDAVMDMYNAANACSFFRTFQGWLSLTDTGPGEGSLQVFPLLRESIAYYILRPLMADVPADTLCGAFEGRSQEIMAKWHPHLVDGMMSIPRVRPGDMVFWHCDAIHAVDSVHRGVSDSAVFFIPAGAACKLNDSYLRQQWKHFQAGRTPPDFPSNDAELDFVDRAKESDVTALGRQLLGAS